MDNLDDLNQPGRYSFYDTPATPPLSWWVVLCAVSLVMWVALGFAIEWLVS